jgi:hypothetical protein
MTEFQKDVARFNEAVAISAQRLTAFQESLAVVNDAYTALTRSLAKLAETK